MKVFFPLFPSPLFNLRLFGAISHVIFISEAEHYWKAAIILNHMSWPWYLNLSKILLLVVHNPGKVIKFESFLEIPDRGLPPLTRTTRYYRTNSRTIFLQQLNNKQDIMNWMKPKEEIHSIRLQHNSQRWTWQFDRVRGFLRGGIPGKDFISSQRYPWYFKCPLGNFVSSFMSA